MALVVFLRGLNVGGYRRFRPTTLAAQLRRLDVVNVGAAGTFVVRERIGRAELRAEIQRRLPFEAAIAICEGQEVVRLVARDFFGHRPARPDVVRFVSVLARAPRVVPALPVQLPPRGRWMVNVLARENRFVIGLYRRHMKVIAYIGALDRLFGVPVTTRSWNTMVAIGRLLAEGTGR